VPPLTNSGRVPACGNGTVLPEGSGSGCQPRLWCGPIG
jgi:hypothetical protein